jgi:sirohydrochlorin ferrochelatase
VLGVAHGSRNPAGVETVAQLADAVRRAAPALEVRAAFIELAEPDVRTALAGIPADRRAVLVPLLLTSGYHDRVDLPAAIAAARPGTAHAPVLGPNRRLAVALADRLREAGRQ